MRVSELEKHGLLDYAYNLQKKGNTLLDIKNKLKIEKNIDISVTAICNTLVRYRKIRESDTETKESDTETKDSPIKKRVFKSSEKVSPNCNDAQEILYENRKEVIRLRTKEYLSYNDIAKEFNVTEDDVRKFFEMRKKLTADQKREIIFKYSKGETLEDIAEEYGVYVKSIEAFLKNNKIITTSTRVISKLISKDEEETRNILEELYDPNVVKNFIQFIKNIHTRYNTYINEVDKYNDVRNDIYHQIELSDITQEEQLKLLKRIKEVSTERRKMKDFIEITQPIIEFLDDVNNKKVISTLSEISDKIINNMKNMENRVYFLRDAD